MKADSSSSHKEYWKSGAQVKSYEVRPIGNFRTETQRVLLGIEENQIDVDNYFKKEHL